MQCFACGKGDLSHRSKPLIYTYKGQSIELNQPGLWCNTCEVLKITQEEAGRIFGGGKNALKLIMQ